MPDDFNPLKAAQEAVVSKMVEIAIQSIVAFLGKKDKKGVNTSIDTNSFEKKILYHFNEVYNWSKEIEFIGLSSPIAVDENTVKLNFYFSLMRNNKEPDSSIYTEDDIMNDYYNVIIEGNPGSGKTTTLKRLISNYFFSNTNRESKFHYPILARLRAIPEKHDLYTYICSLLGIEYDIKSKDVDYQEKKIRYVKNDPLNPEASNPEVYYINKKRTEYFYYVGTIDMEVFLANLLEENKILLILDGLDEIKPELMDKIQSQLKNLILKLNNSKVLITTRPNYIESNFSKTRIYQVNTLDETQIRSIANLWLSDAVDFYNELKLKSYYELANRPLFLSFLIILFKEQKRQKVKRLPKSSKDVYVQILELLLIKWDRQRDIERVTKYSDFDTKRKLDFLSHLAFLLTYKIKEKIFTHEHLIRAYLIIHETFDLPKDEAKRVAKELESHTGIIINSSYDKYEFSHLAIQEYLCASYIVCAPFTDNITRYLTDYPTPLAVAVSLSSDPSMWLSELLMKFPDMVGDHHRITRIFSIILNRIHIESPYFAFNEKIGISIIYICWFCDLKNEELQFNLTRFIEANKNVIPSIRSILDRYLFVKETKHSNSITLKLKNSRSSLPSEGLLPLNCKAHFFE